VSRRGGSDKGGMRSVRKRGEGGGGGGGARGGGGGARQEQDGLRLKDDLGNNKKA